MKKLLFALLAFAAPVQAQYFTTNQATPAVSSSLLIANSVYGSSVNVVSGASAGYVLVFDSATIPPDGTVTPSRCMPLAANTGIDISWRTTPIWFRNGLAVVFSTTGCFTKTASATAFIAADIR